MSPGLHVACCMALSNGVPMLLAWRELRLLRHHRPGKPDGDIIPPHVPALPPSGEKPLPECLIPRLQPAPARPRELELV